MNFFISDAYANAGQPAGGGFIEFLIMIVIFFAIMYFLIIRPQSKRAKEHKAMVDGLNKGDEIVTNGGLVGKITQVTENFIKVEVSEGVVVNVQRQAVATVMPKGSIKDI
ncbi:preprotein translocase subunit YajC [Ectothiorhodospira magna]|uniref:Sec translocon accessory complex subunit YajC n=1 Tax=Ectothiorhodospira magna TaxID=867345 RepID=A0A1H9DG53_9GAMM|nr:preprotein translocase subunit YajC [Ectothiorhodospira magna]SEQ12495.1 preprotein translocase subunit YajC [Ectothiorhodospira magna]